MDRGVMGSPLPPKKEVALALLEQSSLFIHLDPRVASVQVPRWFKKQSQLVLQVGLNLAVQIPDLELDDDAVSCTLSFNRSPHYCYMPWDAVYALVGDDGRGMVWPEDVPADVASDNGTTGVGQHADRRAPLRVVPEAAVDSELVDAEAAADSEAAVDAAPKPALMEAAPPASGADFPADKSAEIPPPARSAAERAPHLRLIK